MIIRDIFVNSAFKTYVVTPHLNRLFHVVTPHLNHLEEMVQMRGHNIWFR